MTILGPVLKAGLLIYHFSFVDKNVAQNLNLGHKQCPPYCHTLCLFHIVTLVTWCFSLFAFFVLLNDRNLISDVLQAD